jgi:hypothetical protein
MWGGRAPAALGCMLGDSPQNRPQAASLRVIPQHALKSNKKTGSWSRKTDLSYQNLKKEKNLIRQTDIMI